MHTKKLTIFSIIILAFIGLELFSIPVILNQTELSEWTDTKEKESEKDEFEEEYKLVSSHKMEIEDRDCQLRFKHDSHLLHQPPFIWVTTPPPELI